jgi:hypothetical protein
MSRTDCYVMSEHNIHSVLHSNVLHILFKEGNAVLWELWTEINIFKLFIKEINVHFSNSLKKMLN